MTSDKTEINPCPFCGKSAKLRYCDSTEDYFIAGEFFIDCSSCAFVLGGDGMFMSEDSIIETWNRMPVFKSDIRPCPCCGQDRTFPTTEGKWEHKNRWARETDWQKCITRFNKGEEPRAEIGDLLYFRIDTTAPETDDEDNISTEKTEDGYVVGPCWWPDNQIWRKRT